MFFVTIYFLITIFIAYILSLIFKNLINKLLWPALFLSISLTFWFKSPGSDLLVPIFSIFLLENTIIQNNGFIRIFRPAIFTFLLIFLISFIFLKFKKK